MNHPNIDGTRTSVPESKMRNMSSKPDSLQSPSRGTAASQSMGMPSPFSEGNFNFPPRPSRQNSRSHVPSRSKTTPEASNDSQDYLTSKPVNLRRPPPGSMNANGAQPSPTSRRASSQAVSPMSAAGGKPIAPSNGSTNAPSTAPPLSVPNGPFAGPNDNGSSSNVSTGPSSAMTSPRSSAVGQAADMQARISALQRSRSKRTTPQSSTTAMSMPQGASAVRRTSSSSMASMNSMASRSARTSVSTSDSNFSMDDDPAATSCSISSSSGNEMNEALEDGYSSSQTMTPTVATGSSAAFTTATTANNATSSKSASNGSVGSTSSGSNPGSMPGSGAGSGSAGSSLGTFSPIYSPSSSSSALNNLGQPQQHAHIPHNSSATTSDSPHPSTSQKQPLATNGFDPNTVISPTAASAAASGGAISSGRAPSFRSKQRSSSSARRGLKLDSMGPTSNDHGHRPSGPIFQSDGHAHPTSGAAFPGGNRPSSTASPLAGPTLAVPNSHNHGIPAPKGNRGLFRDYRKYSDIETGSLKFKGKACVHAKGIEFSSGEKFDISMDKSKFISELGAGNYGTVQKVSHTRNGVFMAVKEIRSESDEASLQQIIMELDVSHRCETRSIISFYGAFFVEGSVYICMEYMNGGSINKIYEGGVPEKYSKYIVRAVVAGSKQSKEEFNIIHRDVKPTNILCSTEGTVKSCDFGVSGNLVASMARTNVGCQAYMAPERIKGDRFSAGRDPNQPLTYTAESDIWSSGSSIIEMANGSYPYPSDSYMSIFSQLNAIVEEPSPASDPTKYSPEACDFVNRSLCKRPDQRPKYADIVKHPWSATSEDECTAEEFGAFVKSRRVDDTPTEELGEDTNASEVQTLENQATVTLQTMAG